MRTGRINKRAVSDLADAAEVSRQVKAGATEIRNEARRLAPVLTGALRRSLMVIEDRDPSTGQAEYRVGWDRTIADYGPFVELGTEDTAPQPHLRPAAIKFRGR